MMEYDSQFITCYFYILKKFHIHLLKISMRPVRKGRKVDFGINFTTEGDIVRVQEHLKIKFIKIAA